jgi:peptidoglycan-N-acetylglucosamine deacetylase
MRRQADEPGRAHRGPPGGSEPTVEDHPVAIGPDRPDRRGLLGAIGATAVGLAVASVVGSPSAGASTTTSDHPGTASPAQQERRGDAFHGDLGIWPIIWSVPVATRAVALTFDDGPDPEFTPRILQILAARGVRATFNMMGWNCRAHPELVHRVVAGGHDIGNHSWSHLDLAQVDPTTARHELSAGRSMIERVSGRELTFFRPPRGELTGVALRYAAEEQQSILLWTINGGLPGNRTPPSIRAEVARRIRPGFIVNFHDGIGRGTFDRRAAFARALAARRHLEIEALPGILDDASSRGIRFATVSELLAEPRRTDRATVSGVPAPEPVDVRDEEGDPAPTR